MCFFFAKFLHMFASPTNSECSLMYSNLKQGPFNVPKRPWEMESDGNFYYVTSKVTEYTYGQAKRSCKRWGASVAVPWNEETNVILKRLLPYRWGYLGISDQASEGGWKTIYGSSLTFDNWKSGEPNNGGRNGNEDCARMDKFDGKWEDFHCSFKGPFICQFTPGIQSVDKTK